MIWTFFAVVAIGLVAVIAGLVTSRLPYDPMSEPTTTSNDPGLPGQVHARDVDGVRFDYALRGYRMDQVDDVLERLRDRLGEQDRLIAELRATGRPTAWGDAVHRPDANDRPDAADRPDPTDAAGRAHGPDRPDPADRPR